MNKHLLLPKRLHIPLAILLAAAPAHAAILIGNSPDDTFYTGGASGFVIQSNNSGPPSGPSYAAASFTTPGMAYTIDYIDGLLGVLDTNDVLEAGIYSDDGTGTPNTLIAATTLATTPVFGTGSTQVIRFLPNATTTLAPNTTYWLRFGNPSSDLTADYGWETNNSGGPNAGILPNGLASFGQYRTFSAGAWFSDPEPPYAFEIGATVVIPEPGRAGLILFGISLIALRRNRR